LIFVFVFLFSLYQVEFIQSIRAIPSEEGRQAGLALYRRAPDEAERILLQANPPLIYRAIKTNIELFRWNRALDIAMKYKVHLDTVLAYRTRYLDDFQREEKDQKFISLANQVWRIIIVFILIILI
jgi:intraflagellar transport protein 80